MFAQLFGSSSSPAEAQPPAPERADEWSHLIESIVEESAADPDYSEELWESPEVSASMRFRNASGEWEECDAAIEHRDDYRALVTAPYGLEEGDTVWLEDQEVARLYVVERSTLIHDGSRLELRIAHVERRRTSRRDEDSLGELQILTGDDRVLKVTVNNVSGGGAQVESREPLADWVPVRLRFRDRDLSGAVRYCRRYQGMYVAGIQFSFEPSELS